MEEEGVRVVGEAPAPNRQGHKLAHPSGQNNVNQAKVDGGYASPVALSGFRVILYFNFMVRDDSTTPSNEEG